MRRLHRWFLFFFFNDTATTEIYTLSLHDALPILCVLDRASAQGAREVGGLVGDQIGEGGVESGDRGAVEGNQDRKSTRLNSSHQIISYAVFCLKKKKSFHKITRRECTLIVIDRGY